MSDEQPERVVVLPQVIRETVEWAHKHRHAYRLDPWHRSKAADELAEYADRPEIAESIQTTFALGGMWIVGAEDLLLTVADTIPQQQVYSTSVLARSVIEWCARALWLFDASISSRERLRRGMTEYLYSLWEQWRIVREPAPLKQHLLARIEEEVEEASQIGFEVRAGGKNRPNLYYCEHERPSSAKAIDGLLSSIAPDAPRLVWSFYSAVAHGTSYALGQVFQPIASSGEIRTLAMKSPRPVDLLRPAAFALLGYLRAFDQMVELYNWDVPHWREWDRSIRPGLLYDLIRE